MNVPKELKIITQFINRSKEVKIKYPLASYYCLAYAIEKGMSLGIQAVESTQFLNNLIDKVEMDRETLKKKGLWKTESEAKQMMQKIAQDVLTYADNNFDNGKIEKATAMAFLAASNFFEILKYFDKEDAELDKKIKYTKYKAVQCNQMMNNEQNKPPVAKEQVYIPPNEFTPVDPPSEIDHLYHKYPPVFTTNTSSSNSSLVKDNSKSSKQEDIFDNTSKKENVFNTTTIQEDIFNDNSRQQDISNHNSNQQGNFNNDYSPTAPSFTAPYQSENTNRNYNQQTNNYNSFNQNNNTNNNPNDYEFYIKKEEAASIARDKIKLALSAMNYNDTQYSINCLYEAIEALKKSK